MRLNNSIENFDYFNFNDSINKGADINNVTVGGQDISQNNYYVSHLILCLIYSNMKMFKRLIELNVELINVITDDDIYDYINKILSPLELGIAIKHILKKHPDFIKDVEIRKNTKKYNI